MAGSSDKTHNLQEILRAVEDHRQVVTLYNSTGREAMLRDLESFYRNQNVDLRLRKTPDGVPRDFLVLHRDGEFLAADRLEDLHAAVRLERSVSSPDSLETMTYPTILKRMDHSIFEGYDKRTMIGISRGIEQFAWRAAAGELHAGFQRLSLYDKQKRIYESIADRGVEVHVYGAPDDEIGHPDVITHSYRDAEITRSWFVVYDRPDSPRRGLLAWERVPDDFQGFWTSRDEPIDAILERLRDRYPPTE